MAEQQVAINIPPKLLKCAMDLVAGALHGSFRTVCKSSQVPVKCKESVVIISVQR